MEGIKKITKMKFGVLTKKGCAEVHERVLPPIGKFDVLLKQNSCNICTTDYGQWLGLREHQGYPMAGGHEGSGIIIDIGEGVKDFDIGDKVALASKACGMCEFCKTGEESRCLDGDLINFYTEDGYKGPFGFADYAVVPARRLIKMNKELPSSEAGFLEPLATVVNGMNKLSVKPQETIAVIGAGTMGLLNALALRANACKVIVTEVMENKIEKAKKLGFEVINVGKEDVVKRIFELTDGRGVDAVVVAVGNTKANYQAINILKESGGRILFFAAGYPAPEFNISSNDIHYRRMEIFGTFAANYSDFIKASKMLNSGTVKVTELIEDKKFTLETMNEAMEYASTLGKYRVSILL